MKEKFVWRKFNKHVVSLLSDMFFKASEPERRSYEEDVGKFVEEIKDCSNSNIRMVQLILAQAAWSKIQGVGEVDMDLLLKLKTGLVLS